MPSIDVLMVTYDAPESTQRCLSRLLETCDGDTRVWLWHNGDHAETLATVRRYAGHPRVVEFHHSNENQRTWGPTNWLLENATGDYLSKVDDDNLLPLDWTQRLLAAHEAWDGFGVLGCWRFQEEDFVPSLAERKIREFPGGVRVMQNFWVEGSCFLMKRRCRDEQGVLETGQSFPQYCRALALRGFVNGYPFPFIRYENLDDPRSPHTLIRSDEDLRRYLPLMAQYNGASTVAEWTEQLRRSARSVQQASIDPKHWTGWRKLLRGAWMRTQRAFGRKSYW